MANITLTAITKLWDIAGKTARKGNPEAAESMIEALPDGYANALLFCKDNGVTSAGRLQDPDMVNDLQELGLLTRVWSGLSGKHVMLTPLGGTLALAAERMGFTPG